MYETWAFYAFFFRSSPTKMLVCQGCIKSCMKNKITLLKALIYRVLFIKQLEETLC